MRLFVAMWFLLSLPALAQDPVPTAAAAATPAAQTATLARPSLLQRIQALELPTSVGLITAHYAHGHEPQARALRELVEDAMRFYREALGLESPLHMAVLTRNQWESLITWQPYGIPGVVGRPPVIFLPATDDNVAALDALSLKLRVTPNTLALIESSGLSFDDAARRYVDLVGLHELGHVYAQAYGLTPGSAWLNELLATYFAYAFLREQRPLQARMWQGILQAYIDAVQPTHRTLADFDRLYFGVGAQNYVWYQAQFQRMVARAYEARGLGFLAAVRDALAAPPGGRLDAADIVERLERVLPGFRPWAAELTLGRPAGAR